MTTLNWNIFKAKFHQREQSAFESLSYMLFCYEHGIKKGIFRFKNQTGIETEPIDYDGQQTGFQAKFYDTKLSANKDDIIDSLQKAKLKNPELDNILIYTNQELSESSGKNKKKPIYLVAIEKAAGQLKVKIEWRVNSHFEKQLSVPENRYLFNQYFETTKGIVDFLEALTRHSETILFPIHNDIQFAGKQIKIDRSSLATELTNVPSQVIILSGDGGSGKTALIKEIWSASNPLYVLKAAEFNRTSVADILHDFGQFGLADFIDAHKEEAGRTFFFDSAEKLADLENQEVFIEFISALIANDWKVIFTTRNSYLDDLRFQMLEIYRLSFYTIALENLSTPELEDLATRYQFKLPKDAKLRSLIRNLFYLREYLGQYTVTQDEVDYAKFRDMLWQKRIQQSKVKKNNIHLEREKCFLQIARLRCDTGNFFLPDLPCNAAVLALLERDEIIKYEDAQGGHFITHDIYEEWALEKLIEKEFANFINCAEFFSKLGPALPMRRAFRSWLSAKLLQEDPHLRAFIENAFVNKDIPDFWKDELLVSILLSDHCNWFFQQFEAKLFENGKKYLKLIIFLLRTACKEVDEKLQLLMRVQNENLNPAIVFTKPKGKGWEAVISFLHQHIKQFDREDLTIIVPMLKEWAIENPTGPATRLAGLFALHFYKEAELKDSVHYGSENEKQLLEVVLGTASELKQELTTIVEELVTGKFNRRDSFDSLRDAILGDNNQSIQFIITLPELTLRLADQAWHQVEKERHPYSSSLGVEKYYAIREHVHRDYYPASALQTPVYYLLQVAFPQTIQFILDFTNRAISAYAKSEYGNTVEEVEVQVDDVRVKQHISISLWCMYRGSGSPVTPYLLQSIHMALEKKLMEIGKNTDGKNLGKWLKHLLRHSNSASISAVVTSVVLAHPNKLFEVALVLFRSYSFLLYDNIRLTRESEAESIYSIGVGMGASDRQFDKERLATCKEPHRKKTLEGLALESQFFRTGEVSETVAQDRRDAILRIIDEMYASIEGEDTETEKNKVLRLFLARIDSRKMSPTTEPTSSGTLIHFNPELAPDLKQFSQQGTQQFEEHYKYTALKMWSMNKFDHRHATKEYPQYEGNPAAVLQETRQLIEELNKGSRPLPFSDESIPAFACAVLIKEYSKLLSKRELGFCKEIILQFASLPLLEGYNYQISDGVEVAVSTLPYLYALFPREKKDFNFLLLFILFDAHSIGEYKRVCDYAAEAIRFKLCLVQPREANEILLAYLAIKPLLDKATDYRKLHLKKMSRLQAIQKFFKAKSNQNRFENVRPTKVCFKQIKFERLDIQVVDMVFQSIPDDTTDPIHLDFIKKMLERFSKDLLIRRGHKDEEKMDYRLQNRFLRKYARFLLHRNSEAIDAWLHSFVNPFIPSEQMARFISEVISEEDRLEHYEQFWKIWNDIYPSLRQAVQKDVCHRDSLIHNYLLAWPYWKDTAREWHTLKPANSAFFKKVCDDIGHHPEVLYSISKFLNEVGTPYLNEGLHWICDMLSSNKSLSKVDVHPNTIYYLNHIARRFVYLNRTKIKTNRMLREKVLVLLNYLFTKGSVSGYLLREEVF
ncbi:MAG: ATP-binding protein [Sediminibacterium magnilacihabitans]|jgi:hypothetical protein|nr:ATP-binding protein [Sediminibacterium magnilacihabitans]PQV60902.1 hypothetical protein CLV53_105168 [Sediminibacterium magnilacihabitans]